ncbi:MAG: hypothetical protein JWM93_2462 [Frankiales bacterium]|nr:hypothetical protein [Frankiales bacterium]
MTQPTVVGLDLSLTSTGIAIIDGGGVHLDRVRSKGAADATLRQRRVRLQHLHGAITDRIGGYLPALVVIEQPAFSRQTGHMHDRSGLWWLIVDRLHSCGCAVVEITPTKLKKYATGAGNSGKDTVMLEVASRFRDVVTVTGNDVADALVLAAMGADHLGYPLVPLPATHRKALDDVAWPAPAVTS